MSARPGRGGEGHVEDQRQGEPGHGSIRIARWPGRGQSARDAAETSSVGRADQHIAIAARQAPIPAAVASLSPESSTASILARPWGRRDGVGSRGGVATWPTTRCAYVHHHRFRSLHFLHMRLPTPNDMNCSPHFRHGRIFSTYWGFPAETLGRLFAERCFLLGSRPGSSMSCLPTRASQQNKIRANRGVILSE